MHLAVKHCRATSSLLEPNAINVFNTNKCRLCFAFEFSALDFHLFSHLSFRSNIHMNVWRLCRTYLPTLCTIIESLYTHIACSQCRGDFACHRNKTICDVFFFVSAAAAAVHSFYLLIRP